MKAIRKRVLLRYQVSNREQVVQTLEGPVLAQDGDVIMIGLQGERWVVAPRYFGQAYERAEDGGCYARPRVVQVERLSQAFEVVTPGGVLHGKAGDWRVEYEPGHFGIVDATVFEQSYDLL